MKRNLSILCSLLTVPFTFGVIKGAERCIVLRQQKHTVAKKAEWKRESIVEPKRYAREQRHLRIKHALEITCGPLGIELPQLTGDVDDLPLEIELVAVQWPVLDEGEDRVGMQEKGEEYGASDIHGGSGGGVLGWGLAGFLPPLGGAQNPQAPVEGGSPGAPVTGTGSTPTAVTPESGTLSLCGLGMAVLTMLRKRMM